MNIRLNILNKNLDFFRAEHDSSVESQEALRNLVFLVSSLSTCGFHEVRPMAFSTGSLFQLPDFSMPTPLGKGTQCTFRASSPFFFLNSLLGQ